MTKGLDKVFGLPSLEDILNETDTDVDNDSDTVLDEDYDDDMPDVILPDPIRGSAVELISAAELKAQEHSKAMDGIYDVALKHGADAAELAFDLDPARAPRMLEVAAIYFKTAMEAKNSKRDAQLKLMKLLQDQRKLDMEEALSKKKAGLIDAPSADVIMVEDRNALLKRLRDEAKSDQQD